MVLIDAHMLLLRVILEAAVPPAWVNAAVHDLLVLLQLQRVPAIVADDGNDGGLFARLFVLFNRSQAPLAHPPL